MQVYVLFIFLGLIGLFLSLYPTFQFIENNVFYISVTLALIITFSVTFAITKKWLETKYEEMIENLKKNYEKKIRSLKREHDMTTLEKTIRDGTQTLIKNAVDYFKIENIKNEMPPSAAIQNLQLDKYGQIIELLADFSLILPDYQANREIVQQEINHHISIYRVDEKHFAQFLQRIMEKYLITVNKKMKEKKELAVARTRTCPRCAERISAQARQCRHCGAQLTPMLTVNRKGEISYTKKGYNFYRTGKFAEAVKMFTIAIKNNPKAGHAYYNRGIAYIKLDNHAEAMKDLRVASDMGNQKAKDVLQLIHMMETKEWKWR